MPPIPRKPIVIASVLLAALTSDRLIGGSAQILRSVRRTRAAGRVARLPLARGLLMLFAALSPARVCQVDERPDGRQHCDADGSIRLAVYDG